MKAIALLAFLLGLLGAMLIILIGVSVVIDEPEAHQPVDPVSDSVTPPRVEYIDRYQTITITPEPEIVTVYVKTQPKNFGSVDEFYAYIDNYMATRLIVIANHAPNKCEVYAAHLHRMAMKDGYIINFQLTGYHAQNSAVIGNEIYFIEPQTGEVWLWGDLD